MPRLSIEEVEHVAWLARLRLSEAEKQRLTGDLNTILAHFERLQQLDTTGVEGTSHAVPMSNRYRDDEPRPSLPREEFLREAPDARDAFFVVPRIVET
ncbi:MAG: Asp-tRNA(Asn)/Glu-tRNA(Gln) amidotransferase subunit GatC [Armatimonadetes bacterium]|nr:Asp-tRNA(Asn)/Glu-tRNA(Gln) amidotransferase subunit GatC [Armatimonadota bacterium]